MASNLPVDGAVGFDVTDLVVKSQFQVGIGEDRAGVGCHVADPESLLRLSGGEVAGSCKGSSSKEERDGSREPHLDSGRFNVRFARLKYEGVWHFKTIGGFYIHYSHHEGKNQKQNPDKPFCGPCRMSSHTYRHPTVALCRPARRPPDNEPMSVALQPQIRASAGHILGRKMTDRQPDPSMTMLSGFRWSVPRQGDPP